MDNEPQSITQLLMQMGLDIGPKKRTDEEPFTYDKFIDGLKTNKFKKIVIMTGAGISVSAGIPDFRSPGTGLYDNLQEYDLPNPQAIFDINFFKEKP